VTGLWQAPATEDPFPSSQIANELSEQRSFFVDGVLSDANHGYERYGDSDISAHQSPPLIRVTLRSMTLTLDVNRRAGLALLDLIEDVALGAPSVACPLRPSPTAGITAVRTAFDVKVVPIMRFHVSCLSIKLGLRPREGERHVLLG
jgi:hypothetical protein